MTLRFDGRVAVVTGAARGIGRAYAELLASRGAQVVVNDLGGPVEGGGADAGPAEAVAAAIGGVADVNDVASTEGAEALIGGTVERFGRIDALIHNAGIMRWGAMPDISDADLDAHLAVHLRGAFAAVRATWPHMIGQQYGRVVLTTSTGIFGLSANTSYAAAKGGVLGLARSLAVAGRRAGIKVNCIAPAASTRMAGDGAPDMPPELVAPMVAYLGHEDCPVTGECYVAGAGRFSRLFVATTPGWTAGAGAGAGVTPEDVAEHWDAINDERGYAVPRDLMAWATSFTPPAGPAAPR